MVLTGVYKMLHTSVHMLRTAGCGELCLSEYVFRVETQEYSANSFDKSLRQWSEVNGKWLI